MDNDTRKLKGSSFRDDFKYMHKQPRLINQSFAAIDLDLVLVNPYYKIPIATLDVKNEENNDSITDSEKGAYVWLVEKGLDVYIVYTTPLWSRFIIYKYEGDFDAMPVDAIVYSWEEYDEWEYNVRVRWGRQFTG